MVAPGTRCRRLRRLSLSSLGLFAATALTAATPTPSPALSALLGAPPSGYVEDTESAGTPIGEFDAFAYVTYLAPDDPSATTTALQRDGFVMGYGRSWTNQETNDGLAEIVVAFSGAVGARRWLTSTEIATRADQYYQGDITVSGIGPYIGIRYGDPKTATHADVVGFVKGNDYFLVGFVSDKADLAAAAATQAQLQYDFAAPESIPSSQWPENARPATGLLLPATAGILFLLLAALLVAAVWLRQRRSRPDMAPAIYPYISPDGNYWWDGRAWRPVPRPPEGTS